MTGAGPRRLLFLCNALDDATRNHRRITTDSPAASRKIFMMLSAIRRRGLYPHALSLGRGRRDGSGRAFPAFIRRSRRYATLYLPFNNRAIVSELTSLVAPAVVLWRLRRKARRTTLLLYNRERPWLLALLTARLLGYRVALDLEDGEVVASARLRVALTDRLINGGALLACSALAQATAARPVECYYGVVDAGAAAARDWDAPVLGVLLGGTLIAETGVELLAAAVAAMRAAAEPWAAQIAIQITGKGDSLATLETLAASDAAPRLVVHGRTSDADYAALLESMHVGLALKLNDGPLAHTTFPSKVTEMAGAGLLVLTTAISDVRAVLGDGARYLERDDPALLVERLREIALDRDAARTSAMLGLQRVRDVCAPAKAGDRLAAFLFGQQP